MNYHLERRVGFTVAVEGSLGQRYGSAGSGSIGWEAGICAESDERSELVEA